MARHEAVLLPAAFSDLDEIFDYIIADSPQKANELLDNIIQSLDRLKDHPHSGSPLLERSLNKFHFRMIIVSP